MKLKIHRQIALVLAIVLLFSSFSERKLYAAEEQVTLAAADKEENAESLTTETAASEPHSSTRSSEQEDEPQTNSAAQDQPDKNSETVTEEMIDEESELESEAAFEVESENATETVLDAQDEPQSETVPEYNKEKVWGLDIFCPAALEPENAPYDENQEEFTQKLLYGQKTRNIFPAKYDAREEGYLPAIRNQGNWGACWTFSLLGAMEAAMIRDLEIPAENVDLSERHLAYFGFNTGYDALDNANNDTMTSPDSFYLDNGGNDVRGVIRLMNWNGGAIESAYPYPGSTLPDALERTDAQDAAVYLENAYRYDFANAQDKDEAIYVVKKMIMEYGAVSWSYYNDLSYLNYDAKSYYNYKGGSASAKTNHAIMAVGWDDNYAKENFLEGHQPQNDGAWIIRNSWGTILGEEGYWYISYEDVSLGSGNPVYAFTVSDTARYDNNYFYGNTAYAQATISARRAAQVYTMKSKKAAREELTAVSLFIGTSDVDYELQIYKNPDQTDGVVTDPTSGTPMFDTPQKGTLSYAGMHTIALDAPITFDVGDRVSVVFTFPQTRPAMYFDRSYVNGQQKGVHINEKGQSFYGSSLTSWQDGNANDRTFRINAFTVDCDDTVPEIKRIDVAKAQDFNTPPAVHITWSTCTDADSYKIYRAENNEDYVLVDTLESTVKSYVDMLPERTMPRYYYKVAAVYGTDEVLSDAVSRRVDGKVKAPICTYKDYDGNTAVLTWNEVRGADSYEIWGLLRGAGSYVHIADLEAEAHSYKISLDGWGRYYYKVRAKQGDAYTDWGELRIQHDLRWEQRDYYNAYYEWQPVEGAVSYRLCHRVNGKLLAAKIDNTGAYASADMSGKDYLPCDMHQYYVEAYDAAGASGTKISTSSTITFRMIPDALRIDSVVYDYKNTITLKWSGGQGADKITIYRSESVSDIGNVIAAPDVETGGYDDTVYKGKTYYYTLIPIAIDSNGEQVEGNPVTSEEIVTFPDTVILDTAQYLEETGVELAWSAAKGADGYFVERSDNDRDFILLGAVDDGAAVTYTDKTAKKGNRYKYRMMSYYLAEDNSKTATSVQNELTVEILPAPAMFSKITELKRTNGKTRVSLSWDVVEDAQSYAVYRCAVSSGNYECIAKTVTQEQYIDSTAAPDTPYSYKLIVTVNGLVSEIEKTKDQTIVTRPVLTALNLSAEYLELVKDTEQAFEITPVPAHYPYKEEIIWSAYDENGKSLAVIQENDTIVINGTDGKTILLISENKIHAVQDSETVRITLVATADEIDAQCKVFVYSNNFWVSGIKDVIYTGAAMKPKLHVYDGKMLLTEGVDYTVAYKNNVKVSTDETQDSKKPAVVVKGKGCYTGTQTIYFKILPEALEDAQKTSILKAKVGSIKALTYEGSPIEPKPVVKYGKDTLKEGEDYTLSYEKNDGAGTAEVVISGINNYKGTKRVSFKINYDIQKDDSRLFSAELDTPDVPYEKSGAKPHPKVRCGGRILKEGVDYKLSYKNNRAIASGSDKKAPAIIITGKGSYKGKKEIVFNIVQQDLGNLTLTARDKVYVEKTGNFTTSFVITDKDGKKLSPGKDYDKTSVTYVYADTGMPVAATDIVPKGTKLRITVNAAASGAYQGKISGEYRIAAHDIQKAKITVAAQTYTGSVIEPDSQTGVVVMYKGYPDGLSQNVQYEIIGYTDNIQKGTATLYVKGIGDFCGTKAVKFKIKTRRFQWWWQKE